MVLCNRCFRYCAKKTDVESLGIGKKNFSVGRIVTARMEGFGTTDISKEDIKINGESFTATDFDLDQQL